MGNALEPSWVLFSRLDFAAPEDRRTPVQILRAIAYLIVAASVRESNCWN
jgi:hypothetical protein